MFGAQGKCGDEYGVSLLTLTYTYDNRGRLTRVEKGSKKVSGRNGTAADSEL